MSRDFSVEPIGLAADESAEYIGVGLTKFHEMVADGRMPTARRIDGRVLWDREELRLAFKNLPRADDRQPKARPLDRMSA